MKMITTLEKVKRLEQYIAADGSAVDPVIHMAIDKLMEREIRRLLKLKARLRDQLEEFERTYAMNSPDFCTRYESGKMGDDMDFIEWAATVEMLKNTENRLLLLKMESYS
ncbi:MAG: hypothetical protein BA873_12620 [Desulfobulbaceae bacterium C00003063]|nr:MAG: hypothetical protein BA873_12620 [Desulfobulbaceae bacterium C00003063]